MSTSATHPQEAHVLQDATVSVRIWHNLQVKPRRGSETDFKAGVNGDEELEENLCLCVPPGVTGQRQVEGVGPEGGGFTLLVASPHDVCSVSLR